MHRWRGRFAANAPESINWITVSRLKKNSARRPLTIIKRSMRGHSKISRARIRSKIDIQVSSFHPFLKVPWSLSERRAQSRSRSSRMSGGTQRQEERSSLLHVYRTTIRKAPESGTPPSRRIRCIFRHSKVHIIQCLSIRTSIRMLRTSDFL